MAKDTPENAAPESGTEIANPGNGQLVTGPRVAIQFREWLNRTAEDGAQDRAFDVAAGQLERILSAQTVDEIMNADMQGTYETRDLVGFEMMVHPGIRYAKSSEQFDSTLGVYAQWDATALMDLPERAIVAGMDMIVSSGAALVIGKLRSLDAGGFLPYPVKVIGVSAPNGTVIKLGKVPARPVKA